MQGIEAWQLYLCAVFWESFKNPMEQNKKDLKNKHLFFHFNEKTTKNIFDAAPTDKTNKNGKAQIWKEEAIWVEQRY